MQILRKELNYSKQKTFSMLGAALFVVMVLWSMSLSAQKAYTISSGNNYLAHRYNSTTSGYELYTTRVFSDSCVWYSPNTNNYYFTSIDGSTLYYLSAAFATTSTADGAYATNSAYGAGALLTIRAADDEVRALLGSNTSNYYFYNWDWGLAHGQQYEGGSCPTEFNSAGSECWRAYWLVYDNALGGSEPQWHMSTTSSYEAVEHIATFEPVRIIRHQVTAGAQTGGLSAISGGAITFNGSINPTATIGDYSDQITPAYTSLATGALDNCRGDWTVRVCDTIWTTHNFYPTMFYTDDHGTAEPPAVEHDYTAGQVTSYRWTLSGEGTAYLTLNGENTATPTVDYSTSCYDASGSTATLTLTITWPDGSTQSASAVITIPQHLENPTAMTVAPSTMELVEFGAAGELELTFTPTEHVNTTVNSVSSPTDIATASGTTVTPVSVGQTTVTVTSAVAPSVSGSVTVLVRPAAPTISYTMSNDQALVTLTNSSTHCSAGQLQYKTGSGDWTNFSAAFLVNSGVEITARLLCTSCSGCGDAGITSPEVKESPRVTSGVRGDYVILNDYEDHSWSYYSDPQCPIRSLNPVDVKITYYGNGSGDGTAAKPYNMTTTDNADNPTSFGANATGVKVGIATGEDQSIFVYYKTLERADGGTESYTSKSQATGDAEYTTIPNPFQVRPVYVVASPDPAPEPFSDVTNFESDVNGWTFVNSTTNYWVRGTATDNGGSYSMYITNNGTRNEYTMNTNAVSYAYKTLTLSAGTYTISYDWKANGETYYGTRYDYLRVLLAPNSATFTRDALNSGLSATGVPTGWTALDGGTALNGSNSWTSANSDFTIASDGSYKIVFVWNNDNSSGNNSPAAIDNISITESVGGGAGDVDKYRGFYAWRVKSKSDGLTIKNAATPTTTYGVNAIIPAETKILFSTTNEYNNTVDFEALWAQAYVQAGNTDMTNYVADGVTSAYERNFHVVNNANQTASNYQKSYPLTITSCYPDGTSAGGSLAAGNFTAAADTKFENISVGTSNNYTYNGAGHDLIFGRGVTGTVNTINGCGNPTSTALNYTIRIESGFVNNYYAAWSGNTRHNNTLSSLTILGNDYDRSTDDNSKLRFGTGNLYGGGTMAINNASNRNNMTFDWIIKSGAIQDTSDIGTATADQSLYMGSSQSGNNNYYTLQYIGKRRLTMEGGVVSNIAVGMNSSTNARVQNNSSYEASNYSVNSGDAAYVRIKGGRVKGVVYGAAEFAGASGDRRYIFTGGQVFGWIAGGANGTRTDGGEMYGDTRLYIGGNFKCNSNNSSTAIGSGQARGGNIFGAGSGNSSATGDAATVGRVNSSTIVIADNAEVERNVYGGGNYGYVREGGSSNIHILGGTVGGGVFGGSNMQKGQSVSITMRGGNVQGGVFGGSNTQGTVLGPVTISVTGGTVGVSESSTANVHGGGFGNSTRITGNIDIVIGHADSSATQPTIYGDVYGGSAMGTVNGTAYSSALHTLVTVNQGLITGNGTTNTAKIKGDGSDDAQTFTATGSVYGGGLGITASYAANVYGGTVKVTVNGGTMNRTFGANNANGLPYGSVETEITGGTIGNVYGGGNAAPYGAQPNNTTPKVTMTGGTVLYDVFGGGLGANARVTRDTRVDIKGTSVVNGNVFGGGSEAEVGASGNSHNTLVNILGSARVDGNVYGGGNRAKVWGNTVVNVGE